MNLLLLNIRRSRKRIPYGKSGLFSQGIRFYLILSDGPYDHRAP